MNRLIPFALLLFLSHLTAAGQNYKVLRVFGDVNRKSGQSIKKGEIVQGNEEVSYTSTKDGLRVFSDGKIYLLTPPGLAVKPTGKIQLLLSHFIRKPTTGSLSGKELQFPYCYISFDTLSTLRPTDEVSWYTGQHLVLQAPSKVPAQHAMLLISSSNQKLTIQSTKVESNGDLFDFDLVSINNHSWNVNAVNVSVILYNDADHISNNIDIKVHILDKTRLNEKIKTIYSDPNTALFCPKGDEYRETLKTFIEESLIASYGLVVSQQVDQIITTYLTQHE